MDIETDEGRAIAKARSLTPLHSMVGIIMAILLLHFLRLTSWVTAPLVLAFFVTLAVYPIDRWVRQHVPDWFNWLGQIAVMAVLLLIFVVFVGTIGLTASQVVAGLPAYQEQVGNLISGLRSTASGYGLPVADILSEVSPGELLSPVTGYLTKIAASLWNGLLLAVVVGFFVSFMLAESKTFGKKLADLTNGREERISIDTVGGIASRFRKYLVLRTIFGAVTGLSYAGWTWLWGLDFVFVWGVLAFLLNFVPNIGSLITGGMATAFAFLQLDPLSAFMVGLGLFLIEQIVGNYIAPKFQGDHLAMSGLMILFVLFFWSWVWGLLGVLLAVPVTMLIMMVMARFEALQPIALFLSNATSREDLEQKTGVN